MQNNPANVGRITSVALVDGLTAANTTQLVTVSYPDGPRQLVVTLAQSSRVANPTTPWVAPRADPAFNAPVLPVGFVMRCRCRWGAGGVSYLSDQDYPLAGGSFSLVASALSIDVVFYSTVTGFPSNPTFAASSEVPIVGAFVGEGVSAVPYPLRWTDPAMQLLASPGPGNDANRNVVPYARQLALTSSTSLATDLSVIWQTASAAVVQSRRYTSLATEGVDLLIDVPPMAVSVFVINNAASLVVNPIWRMGLM